MPAPPLQLGLALGLLHDGLHLGRFHDVALDLELAAHEKLLGIGLAGDEIGEVGVGELEGNWAGNTSALARERQVVVGAAGDEPLGLVPGPLPTLPVSLRSMCHCSVSPAGFLSWKAKMALAWLMASLRSSSLALSVSLMTSKAAEDGNLSVRLCQLRAHWAGDREPPERMAYRS